MLIRDARPARLKAYATQSKHASELFERAAFLRTISLLSFEYSPVILIVTFHIYDDFKLIIHGRMHRRASSRATGILPMPRNGRSTAPCLEDACTAAA